MIKTSNKLLLGAALIVIGYLVTYNFALRAEYLKGDYKSRFYHMIQIKAGEFAAIENNIGNCNNIEIEQGPEYGVWLNERLKDEIAVTLRNGVLSIDYKGNENSPRRLFDKSIVITCPVIQRVTVKPLMSAGPWASATTLISGFKQDSMQVYSNRSAEIALKSNFLNKLIAKNGESKALVTVYADNTVKNANFKLLGHSELKLINPAIDKSTFSYTDSATLTLTGKALQLLRNF